MLSAQPPSIKTELERICYEIPDPMPRNTHVVPDASSGPSSRAGQSAAGALGSRFAKPGRPIGSAAKIE